MFDNSQEDVVMNDNQANNLKFVKIVEQYPEIYDLTKDSYRMQTAWNEIVKDVWNELHEECTVDELKLRWKGIRSSFKRFKNKLQTDYKTNNCKKYYLYDSLRFLDPFTRLKRNRTNISNVSEQSENTFDSSYNVDESDSADYSYKPDSENWEDNDVKPDINELEVIDIHEHDINDYVNVIRSGISKKRKSEPEDEVKLENEDNEDMHFFKSILSDIKDFTLKEKRKLRKGILQLIDEIEDDRKRFKSSNEVSSS